MLLYYRPYPVYKKAWNLVSGALAGVWCCSPSLYRCYQLIEQIAGGNKHNVLFFGDAEYLFLLYMTSATMTVMSVFFFGSHLPEKLWPGKFDIFGHSHAIFHVLSSLGTVAQLQIGLTEHRHRPQYLNIEAAPSFTRIFGAQLFVLCAGVAVISLMHNARKQKVKNDKKYDKPSKNGFKAKRR